MTEKAVQAGQNMGAFLWAPRSCTHRDLSLRGVAQAPQHWDLAASPLGCQPARTPAGDHVSDGKRITAKTKAKIILTENP